MKDIMVEITDALLTNLEAGKNSILVTLVADRGSAPRSEGASMVVGDNGLLAGTIGGGNMEFLALRDAAACLEKGQGAFRSYNLRDACGGNVDVLFTYVEATADNKQTLQKLQYTMQIHRAGWLLLPYSGDTLGVLDNEGLVGVELPTEKTEITSVNGTQTIVTPQGKFYVAKIYNGIRVFVFGGGHVAQKLVHILCFIDFRCIVTDDRPEFATKSLFPDAEALYVRDYNELAGFYDIQPEDYIISVTRGHEGDFEVERFALRTPACYIGVIGSRKKHTMVAAKLLQEGFTEEDLTRITAPIGLSIGSETPAEIAISIAGQLIEKRAGREMHTMGGYK
jgi:xanthine dehydrogenase accessory factor